jgi:hypothetical protein
MTEVKQGPKSDAQRIADRMKPSNDTSTADTVVHRGGGPTRIIHSVHRSGSAKQHGPTHSGEGDITGGKR